MERDLAVVGLGYVGLPLALEAVRAGLSVVGLDTSAAVGEELMRGRSRVDDIHDDDVAEMLARDFVATTDPSVLAGAAAVVICVPTPLGADSAPDLAAVRSAVAVVSEHLSPGQLVVLESTVAPGTTEELVRPALEATGLVVGRDVFLAFSPERIDPGNAVHRFRNTPKVLGGSTPACTEHARALYGRLVDEVVVARSTREAEMSKLLENTYRHVNIALVNEMAVVCHALGVDVWDVVRCAATKPFGFQAFRPGPGVGGHCIPIDPMYLSHAVRTRLGRPFRAVELAQEVNGSMPDYVAARARELVEVRGRSLRGAAVLVVGTTYKRDVADQRETPAVAVVRALRALGADVGQHDPLVPELVVDGHEVRAEVDVRAAARAAEVVVLLQPHSSLDLDALVHDAAAVLDTSGTAPDAPSVVRL